MRIEFKEELHPRGGKGSGQGGRFVSKGGSSEPKKTAASKVSAKQTLQRLKNRSPSNLAKLQPKWDLIQDPKDRALAKDAVKSWEDAHPHINKTLRTGEVDEPALIDSPSVHDLVKKLHQEKTKKAETKPDTSTDFSNLKTMPDNIEGVPIRKKTLSKYDARALAVGGENGITLNTSRKMAPIWNDMAAYQKKAFESGWMSSPHPNHVVWHELAHVRVKTESDISTDSYLKNLNATSNPHFKTIAQKVSKYAATNGHEFIAEVFAANRAGRKLDQDVIDFYKFLKGPKL